MTLSEIRLGGAMWKTHKPRAKSGRLKDSTTNQLTISRPGNRRTLKIGVCLPFNNNL
jgi:hypothetical protein